MKKLLFYLKYFSLWVVFIGLFVLMKNLPVPPQVAAQSGDIKLPELPSIGETKIVQTPGAKNKEVRPNAQPVQLKRLIELDSKALVTRAERIEEERILSDSVLLRWNEGALSQINPAAFSLGDQRHRLEEIYYLDKALQWKENPIRDEVLKAIERLIQIPIPKEQPLEIQKFLAGDKMELFAMMAANDPAKADQIMDQARGTPLRNLIKYAGRRLALSWGMQ